MATKGRDFAGVRAAGVVAAFEIAGTLSGPARPGVRGS